VHYDEYVPKKVLFSNDPVVPNIVGYLEAKRTGKTHKYNKTKPAIPKQIKAVQIAIQTYSCCYVALNSSAILEKIEDDGVPAYLENIKKR
jgi:hypothetical protein